MNTDLTEGNRGNEEEEENRIKGRVADLGFEILEAEKLAQPERVKRFYITKM